ncbi:FAD-dependent monooxygenase [Paraburkholderia sp. D15]|uniref:FAD-dependent monooxygenase n=1 Tax=Paraburkholderia sp. D15 TaxID=2880218 RepID=UPI00247B1D5E|nr:FAD-dependent monooxygenase [Paraburkholderia sp. D15]WGS54683.1 FAD-dependent monooxygenase [Paraburkholderia sp. D15]
MSTRKVLIAGGGIGGLTCALALLRRGIDVDVYEQAPQLSEVGAGFQISANGTRCLFELGLESALRDSATEAASKQVRLWNTGQTWPLFDLGKSSVEKYGFPYYLVYRADLHDLLVQRIRALKPDAIHCGAKVTGFDQDDTSVRVQLENGHAAEGTLLIGADGIHSNVRRRLFGEGDAEFIGCVAWRGLIPSEALPEHLRSRIGTNWIGPGAHVIHYPLRHGRLVNFVGIVERDDWRVESWTTRGTVDECLADFSGWHPDVQTLIRGIREPFKWALLARKPMKKWTRGRVTLLGDACHPTLPFLAQGAVMAIEDGLVLARCIDAHAVDPAAGLERYETLRMDRTEKMVNGSTANGARFHNPLLANADYASEYVNTEWAEERVRERYEWLFEYDATRVDVGGRHVV